VDLHYESSFQGWLNLDGKITEAFWERKSADWRTTQVRIRASIEKHENANQYYFDEGCRILDLATRAYKLWLAQDSFAKRKLLNILLRCANRGVGADAKRVSACGVHHLYVRSDRRGGDCCSCGDRRPGRPLRDAADT